MLLRTQLTRATGTHSPWRSRPQRRTLEGASLCNSSASSLETINTTKLAEALKLGGLSLEGSNYYSMSNRFRAVLFPTCVTTASGSTRSTRLVMPLSIYPAWLDSHQWAPCPTHSVIPPVPLRFSANHENLGRLARCAVRFAPRPIVQHL